MSKYLNELLTTPNLFHLININFIFWSMFLHRLHCKFLNTILLTWFDIKWSSLVLWIRGFPSFSFSRKILSFRFLLHWRQCGFMRGWSCLTNLLLWQGDLLSGWGKGCGGLDWLLGKNPSPKVFSGHRGREVIESPSLEVFKRCRCGTWGRGLVMNLAVLDWIWSQRYFLT